MHGIQLQDWTHQGMRMVVVVVERVAVGRRRARYSNDRAQGGMGELQLQPAAFSFQTIPHCRGYGAAGGISGEGHFLKLGEWQGFGCK